MRFLSIPADGALPDDADPPLRRFLAYWRSKCREGQLPRRRDIDPLEIVPLLSSVFLLDVDAEDFRFSLIGQELAERYALAKGKTVREVMSGPELETTLAEHRLCVSERRPVFTRNTPSSTSLGDRKLFQGLLVPLAEGEEVTSLAGIMTFQAAIGGT